MKAKQRKFYSITFLFILLLYFPFYLPHCQQAQKHSVDSLDKKKLNQYIVVSSVAYGAALVGLNQIWYSDYDREGFHFFNDNKEWKQMDKIGHFYNAFQISHVGIKALKNTGLSNKKAYAWGGMLGFFILTPIEVLDGFSTEYGASWGDLIANFSGSALLTSEYLLWDKVKVHPKYSFTPNNLSKQRPGLLGRGLQEEIIKNYNGMTFWLSFDVYGLSGEKGNFPKWLNFAIGYGAENMISADDNTSKAMGHDPYRQYFVTLDIDLTYIHSNSQFIKSLLCVLNMVHLPAPALEYNRKEGLVLHGIYF